MDKCSRPLEICNRFSRRRYISAEESPQVDYPIKFINNVINEFCNEIESTEGK